MGHSSAAARFPPPKPLSAQIVLKVQAFCDSQLLLASAQRPHKSPAALNPQSLHPAHHL